MELGGDGQRRHVPGHAGPKPAGDLTDGDAGILHHVVEEGGAAEVGVLDPEVGHQVPEHSDGMDDVRGTAILASLARMCGGREFQRFQDSAVRAASTRDHALPSLRSPKPSCLEPDTPPG